MVIKCIAYYKQYCYFTDSSYYPKYCFLKTNKPAWWIRKLKIPILGTLEKKNKTVYDITKQVSTFSFTLLIVCIVAPLICHLSCGNTWSPESHTKTRFSFTGLQIALAQPIKTPWNSKESWLRIFTLINLKDRDHMSGQKMSSFAKLCRCVTPILLLISNLFVNWQVHTDFKLDFNGTWMPRNRPYP